jgi:hypothetical protein
MWKFRHRTRGRNLDMDEPERKHLAGRKTFITVEIVGVLHGGSNGSMVLKYSTRVRAATFFGGSVRGHVNVYVNDIRFANFLFSSATMLQYFACQMQGMI